MKQDLVFSVKLQISVGVLLVLVVIGEKQSQLLVWDWSLTKIPLLKVLGTVYFAVSYKRLKGYLYSLNYGSHYKYCVEPSDNLTIFLQVLVIHYTFKGSLINKRFIEWYKDM